MSKPIHNPSPPSPATGFTLIELMLAMTLSLLVLGVAFTLVQQLANTADLMGSTSDVNENLRAAVNMVSRDFSTAGANIPLGGIPAPYGGTATSINEPYPAGQKFPTPAAGNTLFIPVITAGNALGPTQGNGANAFTTDVVTIMGVNQTSLFNPTAVSGNPTVSAAAATITVSPIANASYVQAGQLIMLTNSNSSCLLTVSSVNTTTGVITFKNGDANDVLGVNQFSILSTGAVAFAVTSGPTSGTISFLQSASTNNGVTTYSWPAITAYPISMVTYYLDTSTPRRLMKLVTVGSASQAQPVALGIYVMTLQYSLSPPGTLNGAVSDPVRNPWPTVADPTNSPNDIRKAVLTMIAEADHQNHGSGKWYSRSITNSVTVQNLDYYNKYRLGANMTTN